MANRQTHTHTQEIRTQIQCLYLLASGFTDILEEHASAAVQTERIADVRARCTDASRRSFTWPERKINREHTTVLNNRALSVL